MNAFAIVSEARGLRGSWNIAQPTSRLGCSYESETDLIRHARHRGHARRTADGLDDHAGAPRDVARMFSFVPQHVDAHACG